MALNRPGPFNRWQAYRGTTIAHRLYRRDLAQINEFFWNSEGALHHGVELLRASNSTGPVSSLLDYGADLGSRGNTPIPHFLENVPEVQNWGRLATIIMMASSFELYLRRMVRLALMSDPGFMIGRSGMIDGLALAKSQRLPDLTASVQNCSEGTWSKRHSAISKTFSLDFPKMQANISDLHKVQTLRNTVAHDFGRKSKLKDLWYFDPSQASTPTIEKLTDREVKKLMGVFYEVGEELESSLINHIGSFEILMFWHKFLSDKAEGSVLKEYIGWYKSGSHAKLLSAFHHRMAGGTLGRKYCEDAIGYYQKL